MKRQILTTAFLIGIPFSHAGLVQADSKIVNQLMQNYAALGAVTADAEQGRQLWNKKFKQDAGPTERSCASCHTDDLTVPGQHLRTHKAIKPMAPSVNPERLTNSKKVEKWFKRNCKWTLGRECTAQEKANLLSYIDK